MDWNALIDRMRDADDRNVRAAIAHELRHTPNPAPIAPDATALVNRLCEALERQTQYIERGMGDRSGPVLRQSAAVLAEAQAWRNSREGK